MKLEEYLHQNKISGRKFATMLGSKSSGLVSNYLTGRSNPSSKMLKKIVEITNGKVTFYDFLNIPSSNYIDFSDKIKDLECHTHIYNNRLSEIKRYYEKYKKSVKQENLVPVICDKGDILSVQSLKDKLKGLNKFTDFEMHRLIEFYNNLEIKNNP